MPVTFTAGAVAESTASVTSISVPLPAGLAAGDYILVVGASNASGGGFGVAPTGYTEIYRQSTVNGSTSGHGAAYFRKWVSGDAAPTVTLASGRVGARAFKVTGAHQTAFLDGTQAITQTAAAGTAVAAPSVTPTVAGDCLVSIFTGRSGSNGVFLTWTPPAAMTEIGEASGKATSATNASFSLNALDNVPVSATAVQTATASATATGSYGVSFLIRSVSTSTTKSGSAVVNETHTIRAYGDRQPVLVESNFDDGTAQGWTANITGVGTTAISTAAAAEGTHGAMGTVPNASNDAANFMRTITPSTGLTVRGWWRVTTEGLSGSNVPFIRMFAGAQRITDLYRQNVETGNNVWIRVTKAAGGSNYTFTQLPFRLELNQWVYVEYGYRVDGTLYAAIDGVVMVNNLAHADRFATASMDRVYLGSHESGNRGVWNIDTVRISGTSLAAPIPTGSATVSSTHTISAVGKETPKGSATVSSTHAISAAGKETPKGSATVSSTHAISAAGKRITKGTTTVGSTHTLTAAGKRAPMGSATVAAAHTITAAGTRPAAAVKSGSATVNAAHTLTAFGKKTPKASATVAVTHSGSAAGRKVTRGSASVSSTHTLTAAGRKAPRGSAVVGATHTLTAAGRKITRGTAAVASSSTILAAGVRPTVGVKAGTALVQSTATITATGTRRPKGSATASASATGTAAGSAPALGQNDGSATVSATHSGTAAGKRVPKGSGSAGHTHSTAAAGKRAPKGAASTGAVHTLSALGTAPTVGTKSGFTLFTVVHSITATGSRRNAGQTAISISHGMSAAGTSSQPRDFTLTVEFGARRYSSIAGTWAPKITASSGPKRYDALLGSRGYTAILQSRRWEATSAQVSS